MYVAVEIDYQSSRGDGDCNSEYASRVVGPFDTENEAYAWVKLAPWHWGYWTVRKVESK